MRAVQQPDFERAEAVQIIREDNILPGVVKGEFPLHLLRSFYSPKEVGLGGDQFAVFPSGFRPDFRCVSRCARDNPVHEGIAENVVGYNPGLKGLAKVPVPGVLQDTML